MAENKRSLVADFLMALFTRDPKRVTVTPWRAAVKRRDTLRELQLQLTDASLIKHPVVKSTMVKGADVEYIRELPADLADAAGVDVETFSLACVMKSEGYGGRLSGKARALVAIGQCVVNAARSSYPRSKTPITDKLTRSRYRYANGHYGPQRGRYAATGVMPKPWHIRAAKAILSGAAPNLAQGCHSFCDPAVWRGGTQRGRKLRPFADVMKRWHDSYKWAAVLVPGVDPFHLILFKSEGSKAKRAESLARCLEIYEGGAT